MVVLPVDSRQMRIDAHSISYFVGQGFSLRVGAGLPALMGGLRLLIPPLLKGD